MMIVFTDTRFGVQRDKAVRAGVVVIVPKEIHEETNHGTGIDGEGEPFAVVMTQKERGGDDKDEG